VEISRIPDSLQMTGSIRIRILKQWVKHFIYLIEANQLNVFRAFRLLASSQKNLKLPPDGVEHTGAAAGFHQVALAFLGRWRTLADFFLTTTGLVALVS